MVTAILKLIFVQKLCLGYNLSVTGFCFWKDLPILVFFGDFYTWEVLLSLFYNQSDLQELNFVFFLPKDVSQKVCVCVHNYQDHLKKAIAKRKEFFFSSILFNVVSWIQG